MIAFDIYRPAGTRSKAFFDGPIRAGSIIGMDSSGFYDGFFKERQTQEMVSFVVLPENGAPTDATAFEDLTFVEAEVGEHDDLGGKVTIRSVSKIGEWARIVWLTSKPGFAQVPEGLRPPDEVLAPLRDALRSKESVVWVAPSAEGQKPAVSAIMLIKCDSDRRAIVLASERSSSYVVKI